MKEMTYFSLKVVSILLFGQGLFLLEELYHGVMATYFDTSELVRMTYPSIVYILSSIILWFSARSLTFIFSIPRFNKLEEIGLNSEELKSMVIHVVGIFYLIFIIPDFVLFVAQSVVYIDFMGLGYMSKTDLAIVLVELAIGFTMVKKSDLVLKAIAKVIKPL